MENFAPGLREAILSLSDVLRVIVYFVCVTGLVIQVQHARADIEELARPLLRATVIVGLVATLPYWFGFTERTFLSIADAVQDGYTQHPMRAASKLRETATSNTEFSLRHVGESLYRGFLDSAMKFVVLVASLLQVPLLILQYVLKLLCYLFLPVALALYMIPSQAQLASRYLQQTLAILAWPVGFAVTELVAYHLITGYANNLAVAYDLTPGEIDAASFGSLFGGLLGALWLIIGCIATPILMQGLFCSGSPVSGGGSAAIQHLFTLQQLTATLKTLKAGGPASAALTVASPKDARPGSPGPGSNPPPPSPLAPPPPSATPAPADPAGDTRAASALAAAQLPAAQTTI